MSQILARQANSRERIPPGGDSYVTAFTARDDEHG